MAYRMNGLDLMDRGPVGPTRAYGWEHAVGLRGSKSKRASGPSCQMITGIVEQMDATCQPARGQLF